MRKIISVDERVLYELCPLQCTAADYGMLNTHHASLEWVLKGDSASVRTAAAVGYPRGILLIPGVSRKFIIQILQKTDFRRKARFGWNSARFLACCSGPPSDHQKLTRDECFRVLKVLIVDYKSTKFCLVWTPQKIIPTGRQRAADEPR